MSSITEDPAEDVRLKSTVVERSPEEDEEFGIAHLRLHGEDGVTHAEDIPETAVATAVAADAGSTEEDCEAKAAQ